MAARRLSIDACVLINLCATGRLHDIASNLDACFIVVQEVASESFYLSSTGKRDDRLTPIDLDGLLANGLIELTSLDGDEFTTFVRVAERLDDGEAATLALALHRGLPLATDDRAALRLIDADYPRMEVLSTSQIIRRYCERARLSSVDVAGCLNAIEQRASFVPPDRDPEVEWWRSARESVRGD
jgi:predicted nucleic acid-binding protein